MIAFTDIFKHSAYIYFGKIVENLKQVSLANVTNFASSQGKLGYLNIKIAAAFFKEKTNAQFADIIQDDFQLFDILFDELKYYMT